MLVHKLVCILTALLALTACRKEPDYSGPRSLELIRIAECASRPHSILAVWKDRVYVADNLNSRVYVYSLGY